MGVIFVIYELESQNVDEELSEGGGRMWPLGPAVAQPSCTTYTCTVYVYVYRVCALAVI